MMNKTCKNRKLLLTFHVFKASGKIIRVCQGKQGEGNANFWVGLQKYICPAALYCWLTIYLGVKKLTFLVANLPFLYFWSSGGSSLFRRVQRFAHFKISIHAISLPGTVYTPPFHEFCVFASSFDDTNLCMHCSHTLNDIIIPCT